ncbi:hypothetical protein [Rhodopirellula europaea]|uniref:Uncharacterized protein n=1 Tax=Rhodopirellula europaea SH398 TaxID=1263868 RepID=M5S1L4_9BACT|nr:hypothetical protein [Rhodopirellula europaea]EMI25445.1 hypothetical protein RESH_03945 [Rhodopirellula europaea SH398]
MDQLKQSFAAAAKYGFWIGTGTITLGALVIWFLVTGELVEENNSRTSKIKSDVSAVSTLRSELPEHPNQISKAAMDSLVEGRQAEVLEVWQEVYDAQRDILVWPEEELTTEFVDEFRDLMPIETHIAYPPEDGQEIPSSYRNLYAYYIKDVLPSIAEIAKAEWEAEFRSAGAGGMDAMMGGGMDSMMGGMDGMGGYGGMGRGPINIAGVEDVPLVDWPVSSQSAIITELFPWQGRTPSTLDVYYSQENLWILRQLLAIVADVNGEAQQPFEAKIHVINHLSLGKKVKFTSGSIQKPGVAMTGGMGGMGMDMGMDMGMGMDDMYGGMEGGDMYGGMDSGMGTMSEAPDPVDNRYVDTSYEPIDGATLRSALESDSPEDAPLKVAKRVPVMMSLQIDQRYIPDLLAACGSAPLMVEVKQVRILPKSAGASAVGSMGGGGGMGGGMDSMMGGMDMDMGMGMDGGMGMGGMGMGGMGGGASQGPKEKFPLDVTVEVYGLIHIYNPPDEAKLGVEQVTEDTMLDGETMAQSAEEDLKGAGNGAGADATTQPAVDTPDSALPPPAADPDATTPAEDAATPDANEASPQPAGEAAVPDNSASATS